MLKITTVAGYKKIIWNTPKNHNPRIEVFKKVFVAIQASDHVD